MLQRRSSQRLARIIELGVWLSCVTAETPVMQCRERRAREDITGQRSPAREVRQLPEVLATR
jgi:hypothetical protein